MENPTYPPQLESLLSREQAPAKLFAQLLPVLGDVLACDRCFLYLRHPESRLGQVPFCWRRSDRFTDVTDTEWKVEDPAALEQRDPLFAAALRGEHSIFIEDVETADPAVVNLEFERQHFGHRALVHAHLVSNDQLWGILQPCSFERPRPWQELDKTVVIQTVQKITPLAVKYVETHCPAANLTPQ
ncbi:MAG: GAF domain-containing protein [Leptolyngbyaceae cyanobacterium SM1_1_3]|nr:GAF domain-containing protein [Leptolyngbyaceae cyanobacterium SM1_1_3]NJN03326.1 GAF domain-containing protein [Leptolyngbyaceae cyanobacterium RM1_1_2]NJO11294.1 GAF domain-containing protein [Leptolyngbyaceae cyanobacterium SL_1_1]